LALLPDHPHHVRVSRHGRRLIRNMLKRVLTRQHAGVVTAQVNSLGHEVHRGDAHATNPLPADTDRIGPGQRIRLGAEFRILLRKLHDSRNLREQQALMREIRHRLLVVITRAVKLRELREKAGEAAGRAKRAAGRARRAVGRWGRLFLVWLRGRPRWARGKLMGRGKVTRTVGNRTRPATVTRTRAARTTATRARDTAPEVPAVRTRAKKETTGTRTRASRPTT
jgi:hypothetical protein